MDLAQFQIVFQKYSNLPVSLNSNMPAQESATSSLVVANLNAMHASRQACSYTKWI